MTSYLLPCACGRKISIELRQAGQAVSCICGATITAPTMREIHALEPAPLVDAQGRASAYWGLPQRVRMLGVVVALLAGTLAAGLYWFRPQAPSRSRFADAREADIQQMTPLESIGYFRNGLLPGLNPERLPGEKEYDKRIMHYRVWLGLTGAFFIGGAALIGVGTRMARRRTVS